VPDSGTEFIEMFAIGELFLDSETSISTTLLVTSTASYQSGDVVGTVSISYSRTSTPPVASFTESDHVVVAGTSISFDPSGSYDADGWIVLYEWDWNGDGVYELSTTTPDVVTHTYTEPRTYTVVLRVTDNDGVKDTATAEKTILPMNVIPEVPFGTIMIVATMGLALFGYVATKKPRKYTAG
jgi:PKD repeat protein